jgi:hypothetical protein
VSKIIARLSGYLRPLLRLRHQVVPGTVVSDIPCSGAGMAARGRRRMAMRRLSGKRKRQPWRYRRRAMPCTDLSGSGSCGRSGWGEAGGGEEPVRLERRRRRGSNSANARSNASDSVPSAVASAASCVPGRVVCRIWRASFAKPLE